MLDKLRELTNGDPTRMQLYMETYREAVQENMEPLQHAINVSNLAEVRTRVHALKPLYRIMGLDELWDISNLIEVAIDTQEGIDKVPGLLAKVIPLMQSTLDQLNQH